MKADWKHRATPSIHRGGATAATARSQWWDAALLSVILMLVSWLTVNAGIRVGDRFIMRGTGYPAAHEVAPDLFRFDAKYYLQIADEGYAYDGRPDSSPNIVFAPMFPMLVRGASALTPLSSVDAGFLLNKLLLVGAVFFWLLYLAGQLGFNSALAILLASVTSAGAYSLHALYSESTLLFFMGLCFWAHAREKWWLAALACAAMSASRLTAFPVAVVFAVDFGIKAFRNRSVPAVALERLSYAALCVCGTAAYLVYIGRTFGDPLPLLQEIQQTSWGRFHQSVSWVKLLDGAYLFDYALAAYHRGWRTVFDSRSINLLWLLLGLIASVHLMLSHRRKPVAWAFLGYFAIIYWSDASSEFLISCHRFFAIMPPIYIMFSALYTWLNERLHKPMAQLAVGLLVLVNLGYGVFMTAAFNRGLWSYF